jgi:hypothetical protein
VTVIPIGAAAWVSVDIRVPTGPSETWAPVVAITLDTRNRQELTDLEARTLAALLVVAADELERRTR